MAIAKVILNGNTLIDTTDKTVASSNLLYPNTALGADGEVVNGEVALGNLTIDTNYLPNQSTTIEDGWIGTQIFKELTSTIIDKTQIAYSTTRPNLKQCFFSSFTGNTHYKVYGQFELKWANNDTEIYTININDWNYNDSLGTYCDIPFTWSGSGRSQTFNRMTLLLSSDQYVGVYLYASNNITDTVTWTSNNYLSLYIIDYNGYESVTINLPEDPRFQAIYKSLAYRSTIASSAPGVSEWCNSLSSIMFQQFAGQPFSGNFVFNNVSSISSYAFGSVYINTTVTTSYWSCSFPNCTTIRDGVFYQNKGIEEVYFPQCSSIGTYEFCGCTYLTIASFPICTTIGTSAFTGCQQLKTASFLSCTSIGNNAFYTCYSLSNISFPKCASIGNNAFAYCRSLTIASFPSCTSIGTYAFSSCSALTTANFPNCTSIGNNAFQGCSALITINFPNCTSINSSAFYGCSMLTVASFPSCTTIGGGTFSNCYSLSNISFPKCASIGIMAFYSCSALTVVSFPNCTSINDYAFRFCINLSSFYFMGSSIPSITNTAFTNTTLSFSSYLGYFGSIYVPSSLLASYKTATNWAAYSARMVGI